MRVNRQLTAICRRFAAAGLRVTERRGHCGQDRIVRNIACDTFHIKFCNAKDPRIGTFGKNYISVKGFNDCDVCISIFGDNLELIIE